MVVQLQVWRDPTTEVRIAPSTWLWTQAIESQYVEYPRSYWVVWNYVWRVGPLEVLRKIRSRLAERGRNAKVAGIGVGMVLEAPTSEPNLSGREVLFFAPNHNRRQATLVLARDLIASLEDAPVGQGSRSSALAHTLPKIAPWVGWSRFSGAPLDCASIQSALSTLASSTPRLSAGSKLPLQFSSETARPTVHAVHVEQKPSAVLFGLGNYAKTVIVPSLKGHIRLRRIHEVDPEQLSFLKSRKDIELCTSPVPQDNIKFDSWFIAGYHHTHAALGVMAIEQGAVTVIEKPLATTRQQYDAFVAAVTKHPSARFHLCFNRRYSVFNTYVHQDLGCPSGAPIDMHCVVYEIPLPRHHWYNWSNSGSRLISNGCHWIDYFMYVNGYSKVDAVRKWLPRGKDVVAQMRLDNGAYLSMSLTDTGSQRLGVREHIELRHGGATVSITDSCLYSAENRMRIIRRARCNPLSAYSRMYRTIAKCIAAGTPGDSMDSLSSSEATLRLEEL